MPLVDLLNTLLWAGQKGPATYTSWDAVITCTPVTVFFPTRGAVMLDNNNIKVKLITYQQLAHSPVAEIDSLLRRVANLLGFQTCALISGQSFALPHTNTASNCYHSAHHKCIRVDGSHYYALLHNTNHLSK